MAARNDGERVRWIAALAYHAYARG